MSLYRQTGRFRTTQLIGGVVVALLLGLAIGFALGRSSAGEPTAADVVEALREDLRPVSNGLAILPTEYPQAFAGSGNEQAAVEGGLERIRTALATAAPDLRVLDPAGAAELEESIDALAGAVEENAEPERIEQLTAEAVEALEQVPGGG